MDLDKFTRWGRSLVPRLLPTEQETNALHWVAIALVWMTVEMFLILSINRDRANVAEMLNWFSSVCSFSGTLWVGAGVYYVKPNSSALKTLDELVKHVHETFSTSSRHCLVGLSLVAVSFFCQLPSFRMLALG